MVNSVQKRRWQLSEIDPFNDESQIEAPFSVRRIFTISEVPTGTERGAHATHTTHEYCICVKGSMRFTLDDGRISATFNLDSPRKALHILPLVWVRLHDFSPDCVLLVFASTNYDPTTYINDYADFRSQAAFT